MSAIFRTLLTILILSVYGSSLWSQNNEFKIIINKDNTGESLTKKEVSDFFLKKQLKWENGSRVLPVDHKKDSDLRETFSKSVHGKSPNAINAYWQKQIFSGRNVPPPEKQSDQEVITYVKTNPGAIGYISSSTKSDGVKEISMK